MKKITKILLPIASAVAVVTPTVCLTSCSEFTVRVQGSDITHTTRYKEETIDVFLHCDTSKQITIDKITSAGKPLEPGDWKKGACSYGGCTITIYTKGLARDVKSNKTLIYIYCHTS